VVSSLKDDSAALVSGALVSFVRFVVLTLVPRTVSIVADSIFVTHIIFATDGKLLAEELRSLLFAIQASLSRKNLQRSFLWLTTLDQKQNSSGWKAQRLSHPTNKIRKVKEECLQLNVFLQLCLNRILPAHAFPEEKVRLPLFFFAPWHSPFAPSCCPCCCPFCRTTAASAADAFPCNQMDSFVRVHKQRCGCPQCFSQGQTQLKSSSKHGC